MTAATMRPTIVMEVEFAREQCKAGQDGGRPNAVYLFACHVRWNNYADLKAYRVLIRVLVSNNEEVRKVAEALLRRKSPRPKSCSKYSEKAKFEVQERQQCPS